MIILLGSFEYAWSMIVSDTSVTLVGEHTSCEKFKASVFSSHALTGPVKFNILKLKSPKSSTFLFSEFPFF